MPENNDPLTTKEVREAAEIFMPMFNIVRHKMPPDSTIKDCLSAMEPIVKLAHKLRTDKADEEWNNLRFGFNKDKEDQNADD